MKIFGYYVKHIFSPTKWRHVAVALYRMRFKPWIYPKLVKYGFEDPPKPQEGVTQEGITQEVQYINDLDKAAIIMYRYIRCNSCVRAGKCKECSCLVPESMIPMDNKCSGGKWSPGEPGFLKQLEARGTFFELKTNEIDWSKY